MTPVAIAKKKAPKAAEIAAKAPPQAESAPIKAVPASVPAPVEYTLADLKPGKLLLLEFSRPGGSSREDEDEDEDSDSPKKKKKKKTDEPANAIIDKMTLKIVNTAYSRQVNLFPHTPFGMFCEDHEVPLAYQAIKELQEGAAFVNGLAQEMGSSRRVIIDIFPITWDHTDPVYRLRIGRMIAEKLIELREAYTSKLMWNYRVKLDKVKNMSHLVTGVQAEVIDRAIESTKAQRKIMIALYGDKCPTEMIDPRTGKLRDEIRLDFTDIDRAIKMFCPSWKPAITNQ